MHRVLALALFAPIAMVWTIVANGQEKIETKFLMGKFTVSDTGRLEYSLSLEVPGSRAGISPKLDFNYNSLGSQSTVGRGWTLSSVPLMRRCRA